MQPLDKTLRNQLERTIKEARDIAEAAALASLEHLGVGSASPYGHLSNEDKELRRRLRAHGRQLGNGRNAKGEQELDRLVDEVAYEHWHRMLFARFLAENNLLMYPDPDDPVAVTLEECEDLASDEGALNGWDLAARFASRMLPQIFRNDSPVFQLILPPEHQQKLERLVADLSQEVFTASDSLGWVYQFWQAKKKDEVNASEIKIGARELPAVTQLFTEPYMVSFLLDNSLGAWWAARRLSENDLKNAKSEEELRRKASLPGVPLEYLRFVKQENGVWTPAAGIFDGWPKNLSELKTLDPCCGSGHFLVAALLMLVPMRMELEGLDAREAVDAVLRENIHGLEIDQRCVELAAFALALTAWRYPDAGDYRPLPELNVACSGLSISAKKEEWLSLAKDNSNLRIALEELYKQFKDAPILGSLINPEISLAKGELFEMKWDEIGPLLITALSGDKDYEKYEMEVVAQGIAKSASLLRNDYKWIITNVPYLARGKQNVKLADFCDRYFSEAKGDIANVFLDRCFDFAKNGGSINIVMPQLWLNLVGFRKQRESMIRRRKIDIVVNLGVGAFDGISGEVVNVILFQAYNSKPDKDAMFSALDAKDIDRGSNNKAKALNKLECNLLSQNNLLKNPDYMILLEDISFDSLFGKNVMTTQGIGRGDLEKYDKFFWELSSIDFNIWSLMINSPSKQGLFEGREKIFKWEQGSGELMSCPSARVQGMNSWGRQGVALSRSQDLRATLTNGHPHAENCVAITTLTDIAPEVIWAFCESDNFKENIRKLNTKVIIPTGVVGSVNFTLSKWKNIAKEKYPIGLPKPYSDDPTQWIFHGSPSQSDEPLHVAVARLLGYRWPAELDNELELSDDTHAWVKKSEELLPYADEDGIVCVPPVRGEASGSDRLLNLLAAAYGDTWSNDKLSELLTQADHAGKTLETWLREKFFTQHCKLFQHRPFIWHIWDGLRDGFAALVNYHKLDRKNLETLIYTYVGDWISRQKQDINNSIDGAEEKLAAAEQLKKKLELILEGEAPYDIFVRWKPIEKQSIGWDPDLNDGVRLNIRPFITVPDVGKKGAGVLRDKPNIKWTKDRGKDVESAPWYHLFKGDRINDHHLSLEEKKTVRKRNAV